MADKMILVWIVIISLSLTANIVGGINWYFQSDQFPGDAQACWDSGGDTFYVSKYRKRVSCTKSSVDIKIK